MGKRYQEFFQNVEQLERMMQETETTDFPIFNDNSGDVIRNTLSNACADRMIGLMNDMNRWSELLYNGFKGYNDMSDLELINDYMDCRGENNDDDMWFKTWLNVTLEKEVQDKIAIMIDLAKK